MGCGCKKKKTISETQQTPQVTPTAVQVNTQEQVIKMTSLLKTITTKKS